MQDVARKRTARLAPFVGSVNVAWFPWAEMPKRSNMTNAETTDWLRYRAIEFGAPPAFIDAIDALICNESASKDLEELGGEYDYIRDTLDSLVNEIEAAKLTLPDELASSLEDAKQALKKCTAS